MLQNDIGAKHESKIIKVIFKTHIVLLMFNIYLLLVYLKYLLVIYLYH